MAISEHHILLNRAHVPRSLVEEDRLIDLGLIIEGKVVKG